MKLAHFSDLHLGIDEDDHYRVAWLLMDALDRGADHVVIAGDLLDRGNLEDLCRLKATFRSFDLWHPARLTVVPGNHDIIGGSRHHKCGLLVDTNEKRLARRTAFMRAFRELQAGAARGSHHTFAHLKQIDGVALLAIDTTDVRFWSRGEVGSVQQEDIVELLRRARGRGAEPIVVGHHRPIDVPNEDLSFGHRFVGFFGHDLNLTDSEELLGIMREEGSDLMLCGHWHVLAEEEYYERVSGVRVFTQGRSGGMDQADEEGSVTYSYDLLDIKNGSVRRTTIEHALEDIDAEVFETADSNSWGWRDRARLFGAR